MLYKGKDGIEREYLDIEFDRFSTKSGGSYTVTLPMEWIKTGHIDPTKKLKLLVLVPKKDGDSSEQGDSNSQSSSPAGA